MPIQFECSSCGKSVSAPDSAAGKKARCPFCQAVQNVPPPVHPPAAPEAAPPETIPKQVPAVATDSTAPKRGFWPDTILSFTICFRGAGAFIFGFVVIMHIMQSVLGFAGGLGFIGQLIITGWLCSLYLNIILETCAGQDDLPDFGMTDGPWEDIIRPLLLFLGGSLVVLLPMLVWMVTCLSCGGIGGAGADAVVRRVLLVLGLFMWPMTILTIAIHGFSTRAIRHDVQLRTIAKAFPQYLMLWLLLIVVAAGGWASINATTVIAKKLGVHSIAATILVLGVGTAIFQGYFAIVTMRIIGLYYRHYKQHFAWEAE
ncbi:MAG: hypothetical protein SVT52_04695 [Planctomycetota bacterium]|nr:hypothetical protein [Planctomycetota bacterium]